MDYYDTLPAIRFSMDNLTLKHGKVILLLLPGTYTLYLSVPGSLEDLNFSWNIQIENKSARVDIIINAYYIDGIVLNVVEFSILLAIASVGISILVIPLTLTDLRETYLQVLKNGFLCFYPNQFICSYAINSFNML